MRNDFLWGGATAANQYEGGYREGRRGLSINDVEMGASHGKEREIHEDIKAGAYYQLVASALTVLAAHEIAPDCKVGNMILYNCCYPMTCRPEDQLLVQQKLLPIYYCSDVQCRGYYTNTCRAYQKQMNAHFEIEDGDLEILQKGTVDFYSFSYYASLVEGIGVERSADGNLLDGGRNSLNGIKK